MKKYLYIAVFALLSGSLAAQDNKAKFGKAPALQTQETLVKKANELNTAITEVANAATGSRESNRIANENYQLALDAYRSELKLALVKATSENLKQAIQSELEAVEKL